MQGPLFSSIASWLRPLTSAGLCLALCAPGCEPADCSTDSCSDRIRVQLLAPNNSIPTGTYTFTLTPQDRPGIAAVCSFPGSSAGPNGCQAQEDSLTLTATTDSDRIVLDLLAPSGQLSRVETYDISVTLDGKILIAQTNWVHFEASLDENACGISYCQSANDALVLP